MFKNILQTIRKREKLAVFGLLILITLGFGVTGTMLGVIGGRQDTGTMAGEIFGKQISNEEFESTKYRWEEWVKFQEIFAYQAYYFWLQNPAPYDMVDLDWISEEETPSPDKMKELTWAVLLLSELADRAKINAQEAEVRQLIKAFFTPRDRDANQQQIYQNYQWFLQKYLQISEMDFEKTMFEFLKINKYRKLIDAAVTPNLEELYQAYREENEEVAVKYVVFYPDEFTDQVKTGLSEVKTYFHNNIENYKVPEKYQIEYLLAENEALTQYVEKPTREALQEYYNRHKEDYQIIAIESLPPSTNITETVTTTPSYKPFEEVRTEIREKLIAEAAKDFGLDKMTKIGNEISESYLQDKTIDLHGLAQKNNLKYEVSSFFSLNQINELEKDIGLQMDLGRQIQSFQENEISDINSTSKGYIIFRLLKKQPAYSPKLTAQLKEKVLRDISRFKTIELAKESAHALIKAITAQVKEEMQDIQDKSEPERREYKNKIRLKCFDEIVIQTSLKYHETAYFTKKEPIADLAKAGNEFKQTAFKLEPGDYTTVLDNDAYYVIQLTQRRVASGEGFEEQKPYLISQVRQKKHKEFLRQWTELVKEEAHFKIYTSGPPDKQ